MNLKRWSRTKISYGTSSLFFWRRVLHFSTILNATSAQIFYSVKRSFERQCLILWNQHFSRREHEWVHHGPRMVLLHSENVSVKRKASYISFRRVAKGYNARIYTQFLWQVTSRPNTYSYFALHKNKRTMRRIDLSRPHKTLLTTQMKLIILRAYISRHAIFLSPKRISKQATSPFTSPRSRSQVIKRNQLASWFTTTATAAPSTKWTTLRCPEISRVRWQASTHISSGQC